jgi:hypothetical protein
MDNIELLVTITVIEYKLVTGCETVAYVFSIAGFWQWTSVKCRGLLVANDSHQPPHKYRS